MDTVQRSESLATLRAEKNCVFQLKMLSSPISTASQLSCVAWCHGTLLLSQDLSCSGTLPLPCQATRQRKVKIVLGQRIEVKTELGASLVWDRSGKNWDISYHIMWYSLNATKTSHNDWSHSSHLSIVSLGIVYWVYRLPHYIEIIASNLDSRFSVGTEAWSGSQAWRGITAMAPSKWSAPNQLWWRVLMFFDVFCPVFCQCFAFHLLIFLVNLVTKTDVFVDEFVYVDH